MERDPSSSDDPQALRARVAATALENQRLHSLVNRHQDAPFLLRRSLAAFARDVKWRLRSWQRRRSKTAVRDGSHYASDFRPYRVVPRQPARADRPVLLHVLANLWTGGSARLVVDLIEGLGHEYDQHVLVRDLPEPPAYLGVALVHAERFTRAAQPLRILRRLRPELVHVHWLGHHEDGYGELDWQWYDHVFRALETYGCPVIENVNIPVPPYVSPAVRRYVYVSEFVRGRFGARDGRETVVHPGCDLDFFARRGPEPDGECVGMVYRLERDKLDERAIAMLVDVLKRRPAATALVVGGGTLLEDYRRAAAQAGVADRISFPGYVAYDALPAWYERMHVAIAPVHTESFGQVTPFAMGMELPVAGFSVGALPEILGEDALLAPAGDGGALADVVVELLERPERRRAIGRANRERALRFFSLPVMVRRYGELYREALRAT